MHFLSLSVEVVSSTEIKEIHGLAFSSCAFVRIEIDGVDILNELEFEGSVLYFPELERSASTSGPYLVFTCACGIAEDAGWSEIDVSHRERSVLWTFEHGSSFSFEFDATQYADAIRLCRNQTLRLPEGIKLVPQNAVFPLKVN